MGAATDPTGRLAWFKTVIMPHEAALRGRLKRICPAGVDVENLVAESLLRAYTTAEFTRVTAGRSYLFRIAHNQIIDAARRDRIVSFDLVADLGDLLVDGDAEARLTARAELRILQGIIKTLPPQCRRVFVLRRVEERSLIEIADQMGLSVSTVEKHLARAVMLVTRAWAAREERFGDAERRADANAAGTAGRRLGRGASGRS